MDWSLFALSSLSHQNALTLKFPHDVHHRVQPQPRPPPIQCLPRLYWCQDLVTARNHNTVLHETSAHFDLPLYLVMSSTPPPWAWCLSYLHDALPPLLQSQTRHSPSPSSLSTPVNRQGIEKHLYLLLCKGERTSVLSSSGGMLKNTCVLLLSRYRTPGSSTAAGWQASSGKEKISWPGKEKGVSLLRPCGGPPSGPTAGEQAP